jgi:hypothetical protein
VSQASSISGSVTTQSETFVLTSSLVENDPRYGDTYNLGYQNFYVARLGPKGDAKPYRFAQRHDYAVTVVDAGGGPVAVVGTALNVEANAARGRRGKSCADPWERVDVYRRSPRFPGQAGAARDGRDVFRHARVDVASGAIALVEETGERGAYDLRFPRRRAQNGSNALVTKRDRGAAPLVVARVEQVNSTVLDIERPLNHSYWCPLKVSVASGVDADLVLCAVIAAFRLHRCDGFRWRPDAVETYGPPGKGRR